MLNALFGISAVLISFGGVIGKIKPFQLVIMTILELAFHAFNYECILLGAMKVSDIGGTYADHMFGAYFGLAVAWVLSRKRHDIEPANGYTADIFSLIGTLFLWIYWPSFVGGGAQADSVQQQRCIINTILALSASTISAFYLSSLFTNNFRYRPVDIQNATLAGGVAIGCIGNFNLNPVNAIFVGIAAGLVSVFGYNVIQPFLYHRFGLHDTCGIHNLHGMPSVVGALASMILAGYKQTDGRNHDTDVFATGDGEQPWRQFVTIPMVIAFAVISGIITGYILTFIEPSVSNEVAEYNDANEWEVAGDYHYLTHLDDPVEYLVDMIRKGQDTGDAELAMFKGKAATADDVKVTGNAKPKVDTSVHASQHGVVGGSRNAGSASGVGANGSLHGSQHGFSASFHGSQHGAVGGSRNAGNINL
jgi:ammonium transporter Rh